MDSIREVNKNILRNKMCKNCKYSGRDGIDWCYMQPNKPSKGTCVKWKPKIKMRK